MKDIAIYGAGGFGREVACIINMINAIKPTWNIIGFFDDSVPKGTENEYGKILGGLEELNSWENPLSIAMAIGSPKTLALLTSKIINPNISFPNIIAPNVCIFDEKNYSIGKGNIVNIMGSLSTNVTLGDFNILNGFVTIGHDAVLGNFNCLMTFTDIAGNVNIGDRNYFGVRATVLQGKSVTNDITIGAGAVVMKNIKKPGTYIGNPARKLEF